MENTKNECYRCKFLDRYYTKEIKEFQKNKIGLVLQKTRDCNHTQ